MIEMLGVMAIIGVLSIGGIAGYSKAMETWKVNKTIGEYSNLIFDLLEHLDDLKSTNTGMNNNAEIFTIAESLNLVPTSWTKIDNLQYADTLGNVLQLWIIKNYEDIGGTTVLTFDFYLGGMAQNENQKTISNNFSTNLCVKFYQDIAIPLRSVVWNANLYKSEGNSIFVEGDKNCSPSKKCLANITLSEIHDICSNCSNGNEKCAIAVHF